ncbi:non-ribosomal peptide synthetase [Gordonia sp. OPL2]|uniref:non-ribosomal peptide synthetase n=1 Tax=Gordonia sp. OPL2 TaxID=2486274 RepID=UPI0016568023|nr:non-ribosomal peptide synthetase [Gordonia sp. OPL2]ROZ86554.1 amino acid adenylation domain-containing protein [Gordonia sp. OPL2]
MTATRRALWLAQLLRPDVPHVVAFGVTLTGSLDVDRLAVSVDEVLTHVGWNDVHIPAHIAPSEPGIIQPLRSAHSGCDRMTVVDLTGPAECPMAESDRRTEEFVDSRDGADLTAPLWRSELYALAPEHHRWVIRTHHVLTDGAGALRVMAHIAQVYAGTASPSDLDVAADDELETSEHDYVESRRHRIDAEHWTSTLDTHRPSLLGGIRPSEPTSRVIRVTRPIPGTRTPSSDETVAAFAAFCARMLDTDDVGLALPVAARTSAIRRRAVQPLSNVVPLTLDGIGSCRPAEAVRRVRSAIVGALRHQLLHREEMVRGRDDLADFGAVVNLLPALHPPEVPGLVWEVDVLRTGPVTDVAMTVHPADEHGRRAITWEAPADRFDGPAMDDLATRFERLLCATLDELDGGPAVPADAVFLPGEWQAFHRRSGPPAPPFTATASLLDTFRHVRPTAVALVAGDLRLSRADLAALADRWAHVLIEAGVRTGDPVAVCVERSAASVVAFWSVIRAGAVWLPLDPAAPVARTRDMVAHAGASVGLATAGGPEIDSVRWIEIEVDGPDPTVGDIDARALPGVERGPDDRAYILFTSGSTGEPKGVDMPHRGIPALVAEIRKSYALTPDSRMLHVSSPTFDSGLVEMLSACATGAALVVSPVSVNAGLPLAELIEEHGVTHIIVTPSVLDTLPLDVAGRLRQVVLGGESVPQWLVDRWGDRVPLRNAYGPTETRCSINFSRPLRAGVPVVVGPPMIGVTEAILDRKGRAQPPGAIGILHTAGPQVADGYIAAPRLTRDAFLDCTISDDPVMYRTGDLATWTPSGEVQVFGRRDGQVNLRGLRIELGEVDTALTHIDGVRQCATIMRDLPSGRPGLTAFVVAEPVAAQTSAVALRSAADLRHRLAEVLPTYMVPSVITFCDELPRTSNGKLDVAALVRLPIAVERHPRPPTGPREALLLRLVGQTLGLEAVDPESGFLEQGGDSLAVIRVVQQLAEAGHPEIRPDDLLRAVDLASIAERMGRSVAPPTRSAGAGLSRDTLPLNAAQRTVGRAPGDPAAQWIRVAWLPSPATVPTLDEVTGIVGALMNRHPALRSVFPDAACGPIRRALSGVAAGAIVDTVCVDTVPDPDTLESTARESTDRLDVRVAPPLAVTAFVDDAGSVLALVVGVHHIAVDGHSLGLLASEIDQLRCGGTLPVLDVPDPMVGAPVSEESLDRGFWIDELGTQPDTAWTLGGILPTEVEDRRAMRRSAEIDARHLRAFGSRAAESGVTVVEAFRFEVTEALAEVTGDGVMMSATPVSRRPWGADGVVGDFVVSAVVPLVAGSSRRCSAERARRCIESARTSMEDVLEVVGRPVTGHGTFPVPVMIGWSPAIDVPSDIGDVVAFWPTHTRWLLQIEGSPSPDGRLGVTVTGMAGGLDADTVDRILDTITRRVEGR